MGQGCTFSRGEGPARPETGQKPGDRAGPRVAAAQRARATARGTLRNSDRAAGGGAQVTPGQGSQAPLWPSMAVVTVGRWLRGTFHEVLVSNPRHAHSLLSDRDSAPWIKHVTVMPSDAAILQACSRTVLKNVPFFAYRLVNTQAETHEQRKMT